MIKIREYFHFTFNNKEIEDEFIRVMETIGKPIFSNADSSGYVFEVIYINALSVINHDGAYRKVMKEIANIGEKSIGSKSEYAEYHFNAAMKEIVENSNGSFLRLFNLLKKYIRDYYIEMEQFNIVWYSEHYDRAISRGWG